MQVSYKWGASAPQTAFTAGAERPTSTEMTASDGQRILDGKMAGFHKLSLSLLSRRKNGWFSQIIAIFAIHTYTSTKEADYEEFYLRAGHR